MTEPVTIKVSHRPWYLAVAASTAFHVGLILAASLFALHIRSERRPSDIESSWIGVEGPDTLPAATIELNQSLSKETGGGAGPATSKDVKPLGVNQEPSVVSPEVATAGIAAQPHLQASHLQVRLPTTGVPLASSWLNEVRSTKGLSDIVGPKVYGGAAFQGKGNGAGDGSGDGNGSKGSFFGIHPTGQRIVYVVDASSSMNRPYPGEAKTRFGQMKLELAKSILNLKEEQRFFIIFFNEHPNPMPADGPENAVRANQERFITWAASVSAVGLTDPRPAVELALSLNPDVLFLLTDGTFPTDVQSDLRSLRPRGVQINTIAIGDISAEKFLKALALNNRGQFAFVP